MVAEKKKRAGWTPEISYEQDDDGAQLGNLPLIHVPAGEEMPRFLMIWEARDTGEIEPGLSGEDVPVVEWDLRQYAQMEVLKSKLSPEDYDKVRLALGLKPLAEATAAGQAVTQRVRENLARRELEASGKKM
jgi:hypothetical protein